MTSIVRRRGDWAGLVEAAQQDARDDETWARSVVGAAKGVLATAFEPSLAVVEHSPACDSVKYTGLVMAHPEMTAAARDGGLSVLGVSGFRAFFYPETVATTHLEVERTVGPQAAAGAVDLRRRANIHDAVGLFAFPEPGVVVSLFVGHDREIRLSRAERTLLARVALHIETSYRLRRRPEVVKAVLDFEGRVLEGGDDAPPSHVLREHAATIARAREHRASPDALALWPALVDGRLSLVERGAGQKRRYLLVENAPPLQPFRALSPDEVEVISQAARGHSTKLIAYALGVSSSAVSTRLATAASKVGASSRMDLVRLAAMLTRDPRARFAEVALTDAERDVLELLRQGLSNEEIATIRSRSVRTIANQVASLLRKTKSGSRRELVVAPRPAPAHLLAE
ncbi:MAG: hypothetical protein KF795_05085 [Labilithrix sp.]|nr:hypothetical protein [Labilithrix sp.]